MAAEPGPPDSGSLEPIPAHAAAVVARLIPNAFGVALGTVAALLLFAVTVVPAVRQEPHLADRVGLLSQYFYGFTVTVGGAFVGAAYSFGLGYLFGNLFARVRNFAVATYLRFLRSRAEHDAASDLLDLGSRTR